MIKERYEFQSGNVFDRVLGGKRVVLTEVRAHSAASGDDAEGFRRFHQEARRLISLAHPALVQVNDYFELDGKAYLVTAWADGAPLDEIVGARGMTVADAVNIIVQICAALEYLHAQRPAVHFGTLDPKNVRLDTNGRVCLIGFGIAPLIDRPQWLNSPANMSRVNDFSPPEDNLDERSDIYSFGALMYFLFTGRCPPNALNLTTGRARMVAPRDLCPDLPAEVEAIVLKAVSLNKEERFRSVRELRDALARVLTPLPAPPMNGARVPRPVSSRPSAVFLDTRQEEQAEQPRAGERRSRGAALTVAVAALVFAASLVPFWGWKHLRAPAPLLSVEQSSTAPASRETVNKRNLPASEKEGSPPDTIHPPRVQAGQNPRITPKHPRPRQAPSGTVATPASNTPGAVPRPRPIGHERPADYPTASEAGPPPKAPPESTAPKAPPESTAAKAPPESTAAKAPPESTDSKPATRPSAEQSTASPPPESSPMLGGAVPPALRTPPAETPKGL